MVKTYTNEITSGDLVLSSLTVNGPIMSNGSLTCNGNVACSATALFNGTVTTNGNVFANGTLYSNNFKSIDQFTRFAEIINNGIVSIPNNNNAVQIPLSVTSGSPYDAGSFKIKFPVRGYYMISIMLMFDGGGITANTVHAYLKEDGGSTSAIQNIKTGSTTNSSFDPSPFPLVFFWWALNLTDRIGLFVDDSAVTVTNANVRSGFIQLIEAY